MRHVLLSAIYPHSSAHAICELPFSSTLGTASTSNATLTIHLKLRSLEFAILRRRQGRYHCQYHGLMLCKLGYDGRTQMRYPTPTRLSQPADQLTNLLHIEVRGRAGGAG